MAASPAHHLLGAAWGTEGAEAMAMRTHVRRLGCCDSLLAVSDQCNCRRPSCIVLQVLGAGPPPACRIAACLHTLKRGIPSRRPIPAAPHLVYPTLSQRGLTWLADSDGWVDVDLDPVAVLRALQRQPRAARLKGRLEVCDEVVHLLGPWWVSFWGVGVGMGRENLCKGQGTAMLQHNDGLLHPTGGQV